MIKYYKNFILCGDVGYYCLICREFFLSTKDVEKHIRWEEHRKRIKNREYIPKFRKDFIHEVCNRLYCEVCNFITSDLASLIQHIKSEKHKAAKNNVPKTEPVPKFKGQYDSGYIVIDKLIINMAQWNSIIDKTCHLCDVIVNQVDEHIAMEEHAIKLIQSESVHDGERHYRKINDEKYHCFTCKKVYFSAASFHSHWSKCENIDEIELKKLKEAGSSKSSETMSKNKDIERQLIDTLKEFFLIDDTKNLATCKHCSAVVVISFKSMIEHMKDVHDNKNPIAKKKGSDESSEEEVVYREVTDSGQRRHELSVYGKQNSIKLNHNGSKGWCLLCNRYLSAHKNIFKDHVKGALHRGHLELEGKIKNPKKRDLKKYKSKNVFQCSLELAPADKSIWVDSSYAIDVHSFFMVLPIEGDPHFKKIKCYVCNELFPQGDERIHCATTAHKTKFMAAKVVEIGPMEFIREIRPNLFHCGFCNQTLPFVDTIPKHLMTWKHRFTMIERTQCDPHTIPVPAFIKKSDNLYSTLVALGFHNLKA